ncbi:unnamed protein product [Blepharisma stoltei]|uniref:Solute-binding protein family 3/N-terminal domain-containing protein n=1 Tax=Blepharisma stoltei TaxID=1481888 RepID=A0AAU9IVH0_9CILI|nr:unnamed protein product [Blepharisma stoltei]
MVLYLLLLSLASGFKVIVRDNYPLSSCDRTGYEVEFLLQSFAKSNLVENTDFSISCETSTDDTQNSLLSDDVIAIGGIPITSTWMEKGISFSYPTMTSGLNVLVNKQESGSPWKLFKVFAIEIWILLLVTPLILGFISWGYANIIHGKLMPGLSDIDTLIELIWNSYSSWMLRNDADDKGVGKLLSCAIGIAMTMMFYGYITSYVITTYEELQSFVVSYADVVGELVIVDPNYQDMAGEYAFYYYVFDDNFYDKFDVALEYLKNKTVLGLISDHCFLAYKAEQYSDYVLPSSPFLPYRFAAAIGQGVSSSDIKKINKAFSDFTMTNSPTDLTEKYNLFIDQAIRKQRSIDARIAQWLFVIVIIVSIFSIGLSIWNHPKFRSKTWGNFCVKQIYSAETDYDNATQRSDINLVKNTRSVSEIQLTIDNTQDFSERELPLPFISDMREEQLKLIRNATLSLIMYEHNFLANIDKLISFVEDETQRKGNMTEQMHKLLEKIDKMPKY